jgi:hypothetical protein
MKQMFLSLIFFAQNKRFNDELITKLSQPRSNFTCHSELFFASPLYDPFILNTQGIKTFKKCPKIL